MRQLPPCEAPGFNKRMWWLLSTSLKVWMPSCASGEMVRDVQEVVC